MEKEELVSESFYCIKFVVKVLNVFIFYEYDDCECVWNNFKRYLDVIIVCGGNLCKEVICYFLVKKKWLFFVDMLKVWDEYCMVVYDNVFYVFGSI